MQSRGGMSQDVQSVLEAELRGLDCDILAYLVGCVESMSADDRRAAAPLSDIIVPFLVDSGYVAEEEKGAEICKNIATKFGGSGYTMKQSSGNGNGNSNDEPDAPQMLSRAIKMIDNVDADILNPKHTYGSVVIAGSDNLDNIDSNTGLDIKSIPQTQKQMRKQKKENLQLQRVLKAEAQLRQAQEEELRRARMAAIKASRSVSRQANKGVNIDLFSIPHPSGSGDLLTDCSLVLAPTRRYALTGRNGAGKSTLMRAVANYKLPGLTHLRILLVDQHVEGDEDSAMQWLLRSDVERTALLEEEQKLSSAMHGTGEAPPELRGVNVELALQEVYERMDAIGVGSAEQRATKILKGLGFSEAMMADKTVHLSGGWCMRAALASAIFVKPNLLLLDEPTNHLDLHALVWLENWLVREFEGIALVVSHDRFFLDAICTDVLELRSRLAGQKKDTLEHFGGDYSTYEHTISESKKVQARSREAYLKEKEKLREFVSREGKKYDNPAHQAQRKMKLKQLEAMAEVEDVEEDSGVRMVFPRPNGVFDRNEKLVSVQGASFSYAAEGEEGYDPLFSGVDFVVGPLDRVVFMGPNGCGKTSLLNILVGDSGPTRGSVSRHVGCRVQMLQQHHYKGEQLDPNLSALDHIKRMQQDESSATGLLDPGSRQEETQQRAYLSNFGISGNRALLPVKYLSGGQRMRVALSVALFRRPDVLILDEATNHLDSYTVNALCEALESFTGAIIAVSHDESFVSRVILGKGSGDAGEKNHPAPSADRERGQLFVFSKKRVQRYDGSFTDYKKAIMKKVLAEFE